MILVTVCFAVESRWIARRPAVRIIRTATGKRCCKTMDRLASETSDVSLLLGSGFCGGIDPRLQTGDLFLAHTIRHRGEDVHIDSRLLDQAHHALDSGPATLHVGLCESADHVLQSGDKRALAEAGVAAVDMESGPLARWAADRGIPFLTLRGVLDSVEMDLPFRADRPFWISALRHPFASVRIARQAIGVGRALGTAVGTAIETFSRRPNV